uniref:TrbB n=1 Tax=Escherichia coli TaxID=562 RepID=A0A650EPK7_ECOLX|nr:TrbB [Escherichia coli]
MSFIYPVSVMVERNSTDRVAPLLCEKDAQKRAAGWHRLYSADNGMMTPSEETTPADENMPERRPELRLMLTMSPSVSSDLPVPHGCCPTPAGICLQEFCRKLARLIYS